MVFDIMPQAKSRTHDNYHMPLSWTQFPETPPRTRALVYSKDIYKNIRLTESLLINEDLY